MFPSNAGIFQSQLVNGFETGPIKEKSTNSNFFPSLFGISYEFFFGIPIFFGISYVLEQTGLLIRVPIIDKWHSTR